METKIWIKNVWYFFWQLFFSLIKFDKKEIKRNWWWLIRYFNKKLMKDQ